jgi:hypothetical protein
VAVIRNRFSPSDHIGKHRQPEQIYENAALRLPCRNRDGKFEHVSGWSDEETRDPLHADDRNFYKSEIWTRDGMAVDCLLYAGNNLAKARDIFARAIEHRPRMRLTIRSARACCNSTRSEIQKADDGNTVHHLNR